MAITKTKGRADRRSVDDLDRVKGIGAKRLAELRPLVTVE
jgi:DNA uptake protein ComE-like DNA-binding protein